MGSNISFMSEGAQLDGYLAVPEGAGKFPAVVIIHEVFGLNQNMRDISERFAKNGYVALAVDMFSRGNRVLCVMKTMFAVLRGKADQSTGVTDLKNALSFLTQQPEVDGERLGAIGFCMGGGYAIAWSCVDDRLKVIAPYYASNPRPLEKVAKVCPTVGSYPTKDFTTGAGKKLKDVLDHYNIPNDIKIYEGARHSFFNEKSPVYNQTAAEDSWQRVTTFFKTHLQ